MLQNIFFKNSNCAQNYKVPAYNITYVTLPNENLCTNCLEWLSAKFKLEWCWSTESNFSIGYMFTILAKKIILSKHKHEKNRY